VSTGQMVGQLVKKKSAIQIFPSSWLAEKSRPA